MKHVVDNSRGYVLLEAMACLLLSSILMLSIQRELTQSTRAINKTHQHKKQIQERQRSRRAIKAKLQGLPRGTTENIGPFTIENVTCSVAIRPRSRGLRASCREIGQIEKKAGVDNLITLDVP